MSSLDRPWEGLVLVIKLENLVLKDSVGSEE
jgi:hypothetical protein